MNTFTLLFGLTLAMVPGAAWALSAGDPCTGACQASASAAACCLAGAAAGATTPVALASTARACERGMIGVYLADTDGAAIVEGLVEGGPAAKAGLKSGDRIVAVGDQAVTSWNQLSESMGSRQAGERVSITVERDGWKKIVELTLAPAPAQPAGAEVSESLFGGSGAFLSGGDPMTLELTDVTDHDEDDSETKQPQTFVIQRGSGEPLIYQQEDGQWLATVQPEGGHGFVHLGAPGDGKAKSGVYVKPMKAGQVVELEGLDLSHLHESLGKLKGLRVHVTKPDGSGACCDPADETCCTGDASKEAHVFHVLGGDASSDEHEVHVQHGVAKGVVVQRMGGADGPVIHRIGAPGEFQVHVTGTGDHQPFEWKAIQAQPHVGFGAGGGAGAARAKPPGRAADADLDALRAELQALRDELQQLRQSLRRIQAGQR